VADLDVEGAGAVRLRRLANRDEVDDPVRVGEDVDAVRIAVVGQLVRRLQQTAVEVGTLADPSPAVPVAAVELQF